MKNKIIAFFLLAAGLPQGAVAQRLLSLDSCRAMALRNNKQLSISRVKQEQGNLAAQRRAEGDTLEFGNLAGRWYWRKGG